MGAERIILNGKRLGGRLGSVRARRLGLRVRQAPLTGVERFALRRLLWRARKFTAPAIHQDWEPFANDEEALDFAEAMADDVLGSMPPWEGDC